MPDESSGLIMDLGVSDGNDTAFYLAKGFRVIAVEADVTCCTNLRVRFKSELASGALTLLNFVASDTFGEPISFFSHPVHQGLSGLQKRPEIADTYSEQIVHTIDWSTLVAQQGVPRYLKIDIEGNERRFLESMLKDGRSPEFISVECYSFEPIALLHDLGYRRFKLVDQNPPGGFKLPPVQYEGVGLTSVDFTYSSGPFGLDIFTAGGWITLEILRDTWPGAVGQMGQTWFDCHAWKPN